MQLALPALICFSIQMKTQIQSTAVAHRAWPNPNGTYLSGFAPFSCRAENEVVTPLAGLSKCHSA